MHSKTKQSSKQAKQPAVSQQSGKQTKQASVATSSVQQPVIKTPPTPWHNGQPIGPTGREFNKTPIIGSQPDIKVQRHKSGTLKPIEAPNKQQPHTARFSLPGSRNQMAEVSGDPRLSDMTVATVAANKIKQAFLNFSAKKAEKKAQQRQQGATRFAEAHPTNTPDNVQNNVHRAANGFMELSAKRAQQQATSKRARANEVTKAVEQDFANAVIAKRAEVSKQAAQTSLDLMSGADKFKKPAKDNPGDFREALAQRFEQQKATTKYGPKQLEFIRRMEDMAPEMRGSMYFGGGDQEKILGSGGLFAKHTRQQLGMGTESKTTEVDATKLGNHDHVFFFMEHKHTPMRTDSRFASESTNDGIVNSRGRGEDEHIASGSRRISFPLANLMQQGTWAMKQDFLSPEAQIGKELQVQENFVATSERNPQLAARHFMRQMAISALDMPALKKDSGVTKLLEMNNQKMSETVFHHHLRPQLMVPSVVNLNTRGAILDMPAQDAIKK